MKNSAVYIDTLGCFKNYEDSERVAGILESAGYEIAHSMELADIIVVNTCGFIEDAKRESIGRIIEIAEMKGSGVKLIVSGCLSQRYPDEIFAEIPEAHAVIGVNEYERLPEIIDALLDADIAVGSDSSKVGDEYRLDKNSFSDNISLTDEFDTSNSALPDAGGRILKTDGEVGILSSPLPRKSAVGGTAFLKVAEGCDNACAYCAIPMIRGAYRSVPMGTLVTEAATLARSGARELVLIAQDVSAYGIDLYKKYALPELLGRLAGETDADWIRLMYCYEERVTDELIEAMARHDKVCAYIDLPLQHVSDSVLRRMGRKAKRKHIEETIRKLRAAVPNIAIRTTLMTGFPGETEADFAELAEFVCEQKFERLGVFAYSPEDGTRAAEMPDAVGREVAEERRDAIMLRQLDLSLEANRKHIGKRLRVLVESQEDEGAIESVSPGDDAGSSGADIAVIPYTQGGGAVYVGRSEYDAPEIDCSIVFSSPVPLQTGTFAEVLITDAMDYDLVGEVIDPLRI